MEGENAHMKPAKDSRAGRTTVQLDAPMMDALRPSLVKFRMTHTEIVRHLLTWFSEKPEVVRAEILGVLPDEVRPQALEWIVKNMPTEGITPSDLIRMAAAKVAPNYKHKPASSRFEDTELEGVDRSPAAHKLPPAAKPAYAPSRVAARADLPSHTGNYVGSAGGKVKQGNVTTSEKGKK